LELLRFFSSPEVPPSDKLSAKARAKLRNDVQKLESTMPASAASGAVTDVGDPQ
jgi:hypothetical protein